MKSPVFLPSLLNLPDIHLRTERKYSLVRKHLTVKFLCALSCLSWALCSLSVPDRGKRSRQAYPRREIKEMGCLNKISFISFSIWWKGLFMTPLFIWIASWTYGLYCSLLRWWTCEVLSLGLYLKKLLVYILLQNSIKHLCSIRAWLPMSFSLSLSLSGSDPVKGQHSLH